VVEEVKEDSKRNSKEDPGNGDPEKGYPEEGDPKKEVSKIEKGVIT
jgi:hypothetical protein